MINNIQLVKGDTPLYKQLYTQLKKKIIDREIEDGYRLPPIREVAEKLNINSVTVINAYKSLEEEGYIVKRVGSGSYVNYNRALYTTEIMDFTGQDSNIDSFPLRDITSSIISILNEDGVNAFKYEDSEGYYPLKESLVNYFDYYNITTTEDQIQIVSGGQQAIDIISKALLDFGDSVIAETPTYSGAINSFLSREARVIYLNLQDDGMDIDEIESKVQVRKPSFIYLMPFFQKPTGISYSHYKKIEILKLALKYNFYIVEDDLGSELSEESNNRTLKSLDKDDRVIYIKSFTPLFMPGLRLGCIIPPKSLYNKFINVKKSTDISTPGLIQRGFTHYLNKNSWQLYYKELSMEHMKKTELVSDILKSDFSRDITYIHSSSPLFWIKLNKGDVTTLVNRCRDEGVYIIHGLTMGADYPDHFLLNIKSIPFNNIKNGLGIIRRIISRL